MIRRAVIAGLMLLSSAGALAAVSACQDDCGDLTRVCNEVGENCRCAPPCTTSADCGEQEYCLGNVKLCMPLSEFAIRCGTTASCNGTCGPNYCEKFCSTDADCAPSGHCGSAYRSVGTDGTQSQKLVKICRTGCAGCGTFVEDAGTTLRCFEPQAPPGQRQDAYDSWQDCACEACPECEVTSGAWNDGGLHKVCAPVWRLAPSQECQSCVAECSEEINVERGAADRTTPWAQTCCVKSKCPSCEPANKLVCTPPADACTRCLDRVRTSTCAAAWNTCSLIR